MNDFSEKLLAAMIRNGVPQNTAVRVSAHLAEIWESERPVSDDDIKDIEKVAASLSAVILKQRDVTAEVFPEQVQPADLRKNKRVIPSSPFFRWLAGASRWVSVPLSYFLSFLLCVSVVIVIAVSALLIAALILLTVAATAAGILLFITGLLYGVSQLNVFRGAGLYEIGLGIVLGSFAAAITILLYNAVIKGVPFCAKTILRHIFAALSGFRSFRAAASNS